MSIFDSLAPCLRQAKPVTVKQYKPSDKEQWNKFVRDSKNGVFLFHRDYMEYHSDRFQDNSLLFFEGERLVALLPANVSGGAMQSHGGLTFGGVISGFNMKTLLMLKIFQALVEYCKEQDLGEIIYKAVPYIYHVAPADEDLYALFAFGAKLQVRNASSCICQPGSTKFGGSRKDNIRKAKKNGVSVAESLDFDAFMNIANDTLTERHGVKPVHTPQEIKLLASRFPEYIKLFASFKNQVMLAGLVMYESRNVAHVQYAANSKTGWGIGAQDVIEDYLINTYYRGKKFFDFGISTEKQGRFLNAGLIGRKENFGASAVMYDTYLLSLR